MNIISYGWPIALLVVAHTIYKEVMVVNQLIGIGLCIAGLVVMSR